MKSTSASGPVSVLCVGPAAGRFHSNLTSVQENQGDRGNIVVDKDSIHSSASATIVLFYNTYSTMRQKSIKYTFKVEGSVTATVDRVAPASFSTADKSLENLNSVISLMRESFSFKSGHTGIYVSRSKSNLDNLITRHARRECYGQM